MDGGVVDQDVQPVVAAVEVGGDLLDAGRVGHVEPPGQHAVPARHRRRGPLGLPEVAGGQDHGVAPRRHLPGQLPANAAVGPGDEHDPGHRTARLAGVVLVIWALLCPSSTRSRRL